MNILFVVDEFPFPPRNGVTIPIAAFIDLLASKGYRVDILVLNISEYNALINNQAKGPVTSIAEIRLKRSGRLAGLVLELVGRRALFEAWSLVGVLTGDKLLTHYDLVWASPIRAYALWLNIKSVLNISSHKIMAAINDSYALTLMELAKRKRNPLEKWLYNSRAIAMKGIEIELLKQADFIAVQSRREVNYFQKEFLSGESPAVIELKNGVAPQLFEDRADCQCDILFVGSIDAFYRPSLDWFIREVYSKIDAPRPRFTIIGSGATAEDEKKFAEYSITYIPFVENIYEYYLKSKILIAPIFKGFGTINKVIEAMAAGCVVVGDPTAFNGIENFVANRDGLVANTPEEFLNAISNVLADPFLASEIEKNARTLMRNEFSWTSRLNSVMQCFRSFAK